MDETNKQMDVLDDKFKSANARMSRLLEEVIHFITTVSSLLTVFVERRFHAMVYVDACLHHPNGIDGLHL